MPGAFGYFRSCWLSSRLTKTPIRARSATGGSYTYVDRLPRSASARYRLQAVKRDGSRVWLGSVSVR